METCSPSYTKILIRFVGDHDQVTLARERRHFFRLGPREHQPARILRRVVVDGPRLRRRKLLQRLANPITPRRRGRHRQRTRLRSRHKIGNRRPVRREDQRVIARIKHALKGSIQGLRAANRRNHLVGRHVDSIFRGKLLHQRLAQRQHARRRRIMRVVLHQRLHRRVLDRLRRLKIRLAAVQRVHLQTLCPHFHDLVANLHDIRESNLIQAFCQADPTRFRHGLRSPFRTHFQLQVFPEYPMSLSVRGRM